MRKRATMPRTEVDGKVLKDPNDYEKLGMADVIRNEIANAEEPDPFAWEDDFTMTKADREALANAVYIIDNMVIQGHLIVFPAPPNGGKTTIMFHLAGEMADKGYQVSYVHVDVSGSDANYYCEIAEDGSFKLLLPDMKVGLSAEDVVLRLRQVNDGGGDLSKKVFIFDTLKKLTSVINKEKSKELYKMMRSLTAKGMTVILLAHTNKYAGDDGQQVYEGTGDLRADVDELIYLDPIHNADGTMTVSTRPDKVRGCFEPITFNISVDREVTQADHYTDVLSEAKARADLERDRDVIAVITEALQAKCIKQTEIITYCKDRNYGRDKVRRVLRQYSTAPNRQWRAQKGFEKNVMQYFLEAKTPWN